MRATPFGRRSGLAWLAAWAGLGLCLAGPARAETEVDLALVIAVDISYSMDPDEQTLQRDGFIEAFRSGLVHDAIRKGQLGRIAVTYVEWAGSGDQRVVLPWQVMDGAAGAVAFADALSRQPTRRAARTSISGALDFSADLLGKADLLATRRVIDVSGDGPNNQGRTVLVAREAVLKQGITINGLPIMLKDGGYFDIPDLDLYYRDCVIGGPGAFMVPARSREQLVTAIKTKIVMEVADGGDRSGEPGLRPIPAQAEGKRGNCLAGEAQWRDRRGP